jgi:transposase-like protein
MAKRRTFSPEFKAQAVREVLSGAKSGAQVCREHQIKDTVLSRCRHGLRNVTLLELPMSVIPEIP